MTIPAVGSLGSLGSLANLGLNPTASTTAPDATKSASNDFGSAIVGALDKLQGTQNQADNLAVQASTGNLTDITDYMIAANKASLQTQLTTAVRDKAVDAFQNIMGMNV